MPFLDKRQLMEGCRAGQQDSPSSTSSLKTNSAAVIRLKELLIGPTVLRAFTFMSRRYKESEIHTSTSDWLSTKRQAKRLLIPRQMQTSENEKRGKLGLGPGQKANRQLHTGDRHCGSYVRKFCAVSGSNWLLF